MNPSQKESAQYLPCDNMDPTLTLSRIQIVNSVFNMMTCVFCYVMLQVRLALKKCLMTSLYDVITEHLRHVVKS